MKASIVASALAALCICLAGCNAPLADNVLREPATFSPPDVAPIVKAAARELAVGDVVTIEVYKVDALSGDRTIDDTGRIAMPLIGPIDAAGETTGQFQAALTSALGARYLNSPIVTVTLKTPAEKTITIAGSVQQPGIYPIEAHPTLVRTVAMAHGVTDDANSHRVVIFRQINGQRMAAAFDLSDIQNGRETDPIIYPDDVVVVDGSALNKAFKTAIEALPFATLFRPF